MAVDPADWHEPLPPEPVPVLVETRVVEEDGCCPDCGGYLACSCGEPDDRWEEDEGEEDWDDDDSEADRAAASLWPNAEPVPSNPGRMCPCCGGRNDPAELFFPYCSNDCFKTH